MRKRRSTMLILRLALTAYYRQIAADKPGVNLDVEEVDALCAYMDERYVCPSLTKYEPRQN